MDLEQKKKEIFSFPLFHLIFLPFVAASFCCLGWRPFFLSFWGFLAGDGAEEKVAACRDGCLRENGRVRE
jgi:hypothetical protein